MQFDYFTRCAKLHTAESHVLRLGLGTCGFLGAQGEGKASIADDPMPFPLTAATRTSTESRHFPVTCHHGTGHNKCLLGASETVSLF